MLDRSLGPEVPQFVMAALALGAVLLLIVALSWLARRAPGLLAAAPADAGRLKLAGSLRLDASRRLYLVEAGGELALVLTGGGGDVMLRLAPPDT